MYLDIYYFLFHKNLNNNLFYIMFYINGRCYNIVHVKFHKILHNIDI